MVRKEAVVASVAAAGLAVTARVVMGMLRRSHSSEFSWWAKGLLVCLNGNSGVNWVGVGGVIPPGCWVRGCEQVLCLLCESDL